MRRIGNFPGFGTVAAIFAVLLAMLGSGGVAGAKTTGPLPTVSGLSASPITAYGYLGGPVTFSANVTNATSCTFSSNKPITGLPQTVACASGNVSVAATMPANTGKNTVKYKVQLVVHGVSKKAKAKLVVTVAGPGLCPKPGPGANLAYCNLAGANLSTANLTGATLTGAIATHTQLANASLSGVISGSIVGNPASLPTVPAPFDDEVGSSPWLLVKGYLIGPGANLSGAQLIGANLEGADLAGADLQRANLALTDLTEVKSGGMVGTGITLPDHWWSKNGYLVGPGADLVNANLSGQDLAGVDMSCEDITSADGCGGFFGIETYLTGADFDHTSFGGANLFGVYFSEGSFVDANFTGANVGEAYPTAGAQFIGANFTGDDLSTFDFASTNLTDAILTNTHLGEGTHFTVEADENGDSDSDALLTGVISGGITTGGGFPDNGDGIDNLPAFWNVADGYLVGQGAHAAAVLTYGSPGGLMLGAFDVLSSSASLSGSTISCSSGSATETVFDNELVPPGTGTANIPVTSLTLSSCTAEGFAATVTFNDLPYPSGLTDSAGFPMTLTGISATVTVPLAGLTCNYSGSLDGSVLPTGEISFPNGTFGLGTGSVGCPGSVTATLTLSQPTDTSVAGDPLVYAN